MKLRSSLMCDLMARASVAALTLAFISGANAQTPDTEPVDDPSAAVAEAGVEGEEEVVVTGFRRSLSAAVDVKRESVGSVDAILAEDIADFPDNNLAESIQRIPGVSITRDAGEGRQISVRGLNSDFTRVRINGMEGISTTGGTDSSGGTNRSRGFDFNVFASELFSEIVVRKTASGEVEEGSLGATVDLRAARPFDYDGFKFVASAQGAYNDLSENIDPRIALLVSNVWSGEAGKFGALVSLAYSERRALEEGHSTVRWQNGNMTCSPAAVGCVESAIDSAFTPRLPRYGVLEHDQERLGLTFSLQYAPHKGTEFNLDVLYADFSATRFEHFLQAPDFSAGGATGRAGIDVREYVIDGNNNMIYGLFDDVDIRSESRFDELATKFAQVTFGASHEFNDRLRGRFLVGYSESLHDNPIQTTLLFDRTDVDGYSYDYRSGRLPLITYGFDVTDPAAWRLSQIRLRPQTADNYYHNASTDIEYAVSDAITLRAGFLYKKFEFETTELRRSNGTTSNLEASIPADVAAAAVSSYSRLVSLADQWDIPQGTVLTWRIPDYHAAAQMFRLNDTSVFRLGAEPSLGNNRAVEEKDVGGYVQADFTTAIGSTTLRGNVGVRYVETSQTSTGYQLAAGIPFQVTVHREYSDTLPSLNLAWDVSDDVVIRASVAKVMARPGLGSVTPGGSVTVSGNNRTVSSGNPLLDPTRATSYDFAIEWYFARESVLSAAFFYKEIDSFIATQSTSRPFTGNPLGIPDSVAIAACGSIVGCSPAADWTFSQPINTHGGSLKGFELSYQQPFRFLPGFWKNFGALLNYTYIESEIQYPSPGAPGGFVSAPLTGLSKEAWNATLYYEDRDFSARVSAAYRDGYLTRVPGQNGNSVEGTNSTLNIDASASYQIDDNFSITLEALNLTDEANDQYVDASNRPSVFHHTGRQFFLGIRYTY